MAVASTYRLMLVLVVCAVAVNGLPKYIDDLPNVPIVGGSAWRAVGHVRREGGGDRNAFGKVSTEPLYALYNLQSPITFC